MVHFWATWCVPCIRDIPELNRLAAAYEPAGARILAVALDTATPGELRQIAKLYGIRYTVLIGTGEVAQGFGGVGSFPTTFIVDSEGMIVEKSVGVAPELIRRAEARLRSLIKASGRELPPLKPGAP
jgi:thiol-disulfide isomerase/thioredoxin